MFWKISCQIVKGKEFKCNYRKVARSKLSWLITHSRIFKLFMKGKFDTYVLQPLEKRGSKLYSRLVYCSLHYGSCIMNCVVKCYKLTPIAQKCCYQQRNEKKFAKCQFPICKLFYQSVKSFILLWWKMHFITSYPILGTTFLTNKSTLHWLQRNAKCAYKVQVFW